MVSMKCKDCRYGYCSDEQGVIICMADKNSLVHCKYDEDEMEELWEEDWDELWEDEMDELWEEDLGI